VAVPSGLVEENCRLDGFRARENWTSDQYRMAGRQLSCVPCCLGSSSARLSISSCAALGHLRLKGRQESVQINAKERKGRTQVAVGGEIDEVHDLLKQSRGLAAKPMPNQTSPISTLA